MAAPWERYGAPAQQPAIPTVLEGPPRQAPPQTPAQATVDNFQAQAAPFQAQTAQANAEKARLEAEAARREADRLRNDPAGDAGVDQRRMGGFHSRALQANALYQQQGLGAPDLIGDTIRDNIPSLGNYITDPRRRRASAAENEFVAATLRYESGAAIPPEELEAQRQRYFPQPGDDEGTIQLKAQLRENAIAALRTSAGQAAAVQQGGEPDIVDGIPNIGRLGADSNAGQAPAQADPSVLHSLGVGTGAVVQGVGDVLGLVGNPVNYGVNALLGTDLSTDLGQTFLDASGLPSPQSDGERLGAAVNRAGVGALTLANGARAAAPLATNALQGALARFGNAPGIDTIAGATSGLSGEAARQAGAPVPVQIGAMLLGGGAGALGASRLAQRSAPVVENALIRAGRDEGVSVNRAMADPRIQNRVTGTEATLAGGPRIQGEMRRIGSQIEGRVDRLGRGGTAMDENNAGEMVRNVATRSIRDSGRRARELYDSAEAASEGVRVQPQQSTQVIDDVLTRLNETPETNGAEIAFLQRLRTDFEADLSVGALRRIRTQLRGRIRNGGLTFGEDEASVLAIMDSASQDIERGLREAGRGQAATLFRQADDFYRQRMEFIDGTLQRLVGRRNAELSPERVFNNLRSMAQPRGDNAALARFIREMEPEEQADLAATFAQSLGRNNRGDFSTAHFLSQVEKLPRAARINIFGQSGARSIDNLTTLAREHARVMGGLNNSRTGVANDWRSFVTNALFGGGVGVATESGITALAVAGAGMAAKSGRDLISARALMSTNLTNWARQAPRTANPAPIRRHIARLGSIASREPAIAAEVQQLQQFLLRSLNDNASSAAASGTNQQERR